jgi:hypothetical protein
MHSVEHYETLLTRLQGPEGSQNDGKGHDGTKPQHHHESFLPHQDHAHQPSSGDTRCDAAHPKDDLPHATSPPALHPEQQALKDAHKMDPTAEEAAQAERVHALSTALGGVTILFKVCNFRCNSRYNCTSAVSPAPSFCVRTALNSVLIVLSLNLCDINCPVTAAVCYLIACTGICGHHRCVQHRHRQHHLHHQHNRHHGRRRCLGRRGVRSAGEGCAEEVRGPGRHPLRDHGHRTTLGSRGTSPVLLVCCACAFTQQVRRMGSCHMHVPRHHSVLTPPTVALSTACSGVSRIFLVPVDCRGRTSSAEWPIPTSSSPNTIQTPTPLPPPQCTVRSTRRAFATQTSRPVSCPRSCPSGRRNMRLR